MCSESSWLVERGQESPPWLRRYSISSWIKKMCRTLRYVLASSVCNWPLKRIQLGNYGMNEITSPNNKSLSLHDSRGIENGSTENLKIITDFIENRKDQPFSEQLHAIWCSFPPSNLSLSCWWHCQVLHRNSDPWTTTIWEQWHRSVSFLAGDRKQRWETGINVNLISTFITL